jgi:serine/threonine-protein kinase ULK4
MNSQLFKARLISLDFILTTSKLFEMCENQKFEGIEDFMHSLLMIVECLSSIRKALLDAHEPILQHLLPRLLANLNNYSTNFRFLSLKIFADIVTQYLSDDTIYDVIGSNNFSKGLNKLILKQLFPKYGVILSDQDPVPLFGLKLLSIIIEKNPAFITILINLNLISVVTNYFTVGHARLNRYTIKIIKHLVESKTLSIEDL